MPGDSWCVCALRWEHALHNGIAPPVFLAGTHERALDFVSLEVLVANRLDAPPTSGAFVEEDEHEDAAASCQLPSCR